MQPANAEENNRIRKSTSTVWLTAALLAVLVAATISVVGSCLYSFAHQSDCQISLSEGAVQEAAGTVKNAVSQKKERSNPVLKSRAAAYTGSAAKAKAQESAFQVSDDNQIWSTETAIELFQTEYKNADGSVTAESADGKKILAPGTGGSYTFRLKNTGKSTADYKVWVETGLSDQMTDVPLEAKMSGDQGWLLGEKDSWAQASALNGVAADGTIGAGRTAEYTIYWQWPYEQGDDALDTGMGDASVDQDLSYTVTIYTLASIEADSGNGSARQNPLSRIVEAAKTGDTAQILLWLAALAGAAGVLIFLLIVKRRKNDEENE